MRPMQSLRNARQLLRFAAAWVLLSFVAAWASPLVAPQSFDLLCTDKGSMRLVKKTADGGEAAHVVEHCGFCAVGALAAPPIASLAAAPSTPWAYALVPLLAAPSTWLARASLPARGPPLLA
jgi:hypothetical protein